MARYYNSWIENTDQVAEDDVSSAVSASQSEANNRPDVLPSEPAASSNELVDAGRKSAENDSLGWNISSAPSVDDDDDEDDDMDVFRSFM